MAKYRKAPKDPRGGHIRLYNDIFDSMAWRALGWAEQGLYLAVRRKLGSTNNGNLEATLGGKLGLRHAGITAPSSLARGLRALTAVGLIARTREGLFSQGKTTCSLYRFTDEHTAEFPKLGIPAMKATHEWRAFVTLAQAKTAIEAAHAASLTHKPRVRKNAEPIQPLKGSDSTIEAAAEISDSTIEVGAIPPIQPLKSEKSAASARKPHQHSVLEGQP